MLNNNLPFKIREEVSDTSLVVKTLTLFAFFLLFSVTTNAQSLFKTESDAVKFMEGKKFCRSEIGLKMEITYGFISSLKTYGFTIIDNIAQIHYVIDCRFTPQGHYCDIDGISKTSVQRTRFRLYPDRLVTLYGTGVALTNTYFILDE